MPEKEPIGILGAGWVGLVTAACFAELGHPVVVRDVVPERIDALEAGRVPIHELGLEELIARNRERMRFTLSIEDVFADARIAFVCVGTPSTYSGDADLGAVWHVLDELPELEGRVILVMKSTVPVGTGEKVRQALDSRGLAHVGYVSNPEFLAEGTAVANFMAPDRVVVGSFAEADGDAVAALYEPLGAPVVRADIASAEMTKLASNAFLVTRISFINEIANVCELVGADVAKVAEGVGLDKRLGPHFLRAGIGYGGSCLAGRETVLVRDADGVRLTSLQRLFSDLGGDGRAIFPDGLEVLSWRRGSETAEFLPVSAVTRRPFDGSIVDVTTKMGRRVRCTPDHPFVVADADGRELGMKFAAQLSEDDWLPVAQGAPPAAGECEPFDLLASAAAQDDEIIVRPAGRELAGLAPMQVRAAVATLDRPTSRARAYDILGAGALRLDEARALELDLTGASVGTARNGTYVPAQIDATERFWHVVGLYVAEGHASTDGRRTRLYWSFHPRDERHLVDEVAGFWSELGVKATVRKAATAMNVSVSSRVLADFWLGALGLGRTCYEQRLPDRIWSEPESHKRALLTGLWQGDGSWSFVSGGPSVVLEYGTVSRELADGILRLLGDLGVVARLKVGRTAKSTCDTYWLVVSGADQVERLLELVDPAEREALRSSIGQTKRIAPAGYRRHDPNGAWVRVASTARRRYMGWVYSLEVPGAETFVTTGGLVVHNCFPKDSLALKQLAANSGYHFQLLSAVIEVNELQKRRVVAKLVKHLGPLRGKTVALLGLSFKPNTDDLREAPSLVLASRLLAEGATVRAWDPVAMPEAAKHLKGVELSDSVLGAVSGADAAVIVTEWEHLAGLASEETRAAMRNPLIVDGRNMLDPEAARAAGFTYEGIGRAASSLRAVPETEEREPDLTA